MAHISFPYVDIGSGCPGRVREAGGRCLGKVIVNKPTNIADGAEQRWSTRRGDEAQNGSLLNAIGK